MYSIVIPVYKSTKTLSEIALRIKKVLTDNLNQDYEIIFVNDSPFDADTCETLKNLAAEDGNVKAITLTKNFGQQAATLCGIEQAKGDYIITMDDDLQHLPESIPALISKQEHDIVIGKYEQRRHNIFKKLTSRIKAYFDYLLIDKPKGIRMSSLRLFNKTTAKGILLKSSPYPFIPALLFSVTRDIVNVSVQHNPREEGRSNYTFFKMLKLFSNLLINNSSLLLRLVGYLGSIISVVSVLGACFLIFRKIFLGYIVPGWTSLMTAILFFGGLVLFTLGVIGEYLVRIISTAENTPTYIIKTIEEKQKD